MTTYTVNRFDFTHIYDVDTLQEYIHYSQRDVNRLKEAIAEAESYQAEIERHIDTVVNDTQFKYVVLIERRTDYGSNKKTYHVSIEHRPIVEIYHIGNHHVYGKYSHQESFTGKERHKAIKYAEQLAQEYSCDIERKGF